MIEVNIQKQQEELRQIHEQLQRVQGQGTQVHTYNCVNIGIDNFAVIKKQKHVIEMCLSDDTAAVGWWTECTVAASWRSTD